MFQASRRATPVRTFALLATLAAAALAAGCGSKPREEVQACVYPENPTQPAPAWVCPPHTVQGQAVTGLGIYPKSAAGYQFSLDQASAKARAELASQFKTRAESAVTRVVASTGTPGTDERVRQAAGSLTRQVTSELLVGAKIVRSGVDAKGNVYALIGIEPEPYKRQLESALSAAMQADPGTWQQVRGQRSADAFKAEVLKTQD